VERRQFDFAAIAATGTAAADGDKAFDSEGEFTTFASPE